MGRPKPKYSFYDKGDKENSFINPYTFVPLDVSADCAGTSEETQGAVSDVSEDDKKRVTGKLTCRLYLKTPLIIPDPDNAEPDPENAKHQRYPFMKTDDDYIIPGSSIRGPVRSVYETVTNSCMSTMQKRQRITARTKKPFLPGVLRYENGQMKLFGAVRYRIRMNKDLMEWGYGRHLSFICLNKDEEITIQGEKRTITVHYVKRIMGQYDKKYAANPKDKVKDGYLFIGENIENKKYESVFVTKGAAINCTPDVIKKSYEDLKHAVDVYKNDSVNRNLYDKHSGYDHIKFDDFEKGEIEGLPVWYKEEEKKLYLSPACIGRFAYNSTMEDLVPRYKPCENPAHLCKACELFGMIRKNKNDTLKDDSNGFGSRVRFGDAKLVKTSNPESVEKHLDYITLAELSSPKPSYLPFYLNSTDYSKGYDGDCATIRGRKYYWHHLPDMTSKQKKGERNATMEVFKDPAEFEFFVYFDDITIKQLHELEYVLCLGENREDGDLCYKIGHGKPLGYGSAKICLISEEIRNYENEEYSITRNESVDDLHNKVSGLIQGWPANLNTVLSFSFIDKQITKAKKGVQYPSVDNKTGMPDDVVDKKSSNARASHNWFSENYKFGRSNSMFNLPDTPVSENETSGKDSADITLPAIMLTDIIELKKGEIISVTLTEIKQDNKEENAYFGRFEYEGRKGSVKGIPDESKNEKQIEVQVLNPKTQSGSIFAQYVNKKS